MAPNILFRGVVLSGASLGLPGVRALGGLFLFLEF